MVVPVPSPGALQPLAATEGCADCRLRKGRLQPGLRAFATCGACQHGRWPWRCARDHGGPAQSSSDVRQGSAATSGLGSGQRARTRHSPANHRPEQPPPPHTHTPPCSAPGARSADRMVGRGRSLAYWASPRRRERKGGSDQGAPFQGPAPCYDARVASLVKLSPGSPTLAYSLQSWGL